MRAFLSVMLESSMQATVLLPAHPAILLRMSRTVFPVPQKHTGGERWSSNPLANRPDSHILGGIKHCFTPFSQPSVQDPREDTLLKLPLLHTLGTYTGRHIYHCYPPWEAYREAYIPLLPTLGGI